MKKELLKEGLKITGNILLESTVVGVTTGVSISLIVSAFSKTLQKMNKENE